MTGAEVRDLVSKRAGDRCEYCLLRQADCVLSHHVEHIVARQHGGSEEPANLALACHRCNLKKGPNLTGIDPLTKEVVPLFSPRRNAWTEHFEFVGERIEGTTAVGRATVQVLAMNDARRLELRQELLGRGELATSGRTSGSQLRPRQYRPEVTTYVLGAGASFHAGYPLCSMLWDRMSRWADSQRDLDSDHYSAIREVTEAVGEVLDLESVLTDLDQREGPFAQLTESERSRLIGGIRRCLRGCLASIHKERQPARLYEKLAHELKMGDSLVTFNYDVTLECELVRAKKFSVRNGYGFPQDWDEPASQVTVLKPHGSINWNGSVFNGSTGAGAYRPGNELGPQPFVDNGESLLPIYPARILNNNFPGGAVTGNAISLVMPTRTKRFHIQGSSEDEQNWASFYDWLWGRTAEALRDSKRIVVVGYSMPAADQRACETIFQLQNQAAEIVLYCHQANQGLERRFREKGFSHVQIGGEFKDCFGS